MRVDTNDVRVPAGKKIKLKKWPTGIKPLYKSEKEYKEMLAADVDELSALQRLLYAFNTYSLLLIFQAMDAARSATFYLASTRRDAKSSVSSIRAQRNWSTISFGARPAVCRRADGLASLIVLITRRY